MLFSKKKSTEKASEGSSKDTTDLKIKIDSLEMESVGEQLKEIEAKKAKEKT